MESFYQHRVDEVALVPVFAAFVARDATVRLGSEHDRFEWLTPAAAGARFAWPRERRALEDIVAVFRSGHAGRDRRRASGMLARRIIPCLDVAGGRVVKGVHFQSLRDAGDPVEQATRYDADGADELVFLDISASPEARRTTLEMVSRVAESIFIPFTVGGGIRSVADAGAALRAGADKITVNTAAVRDPSLVSRLAESFGSQCVVAAVDVKRVEGQAHRGGQRRPGGNRARGGGVEPPSGGPGCGRDPAHVHGPGRDRAGYDLPLHPGGFPGRNHCR